MLGDKSPRINFFKELGWVDPFNEISEGFKVQMMTKQLKFNFQGKMKDIISDKAKRKEVLKLMNKKRKSKKSKKKMSKWDWENMDEETFEYINNITNNLKDIRQVYAMAIPSDRLMFNLMRACIGIKVSSDLWFNSVSADIN